jgi:sterol desaturase/sphingolipid hydroxylase (fatty acid hydroxylase superfamily)/uncharacterized membrane protein YhhN
MSPSQIIVLATPVFFAMIAIEWAWGYARGRNTYQLDDAINSISLGMLSQISAVLTRVLRLGIYTAVYSVVALWHNEAFWSTWYGFLLALVFYDFCYYWLHRAGHESAVFWAAHVVHHQSQSYNLSTALRQTSSGALLGWMFYLPMALAGVPPLVFGIVALVDLLYQYWVHTEHIGKLGWFDRWFCSPSNHRVHHALNDGHLDRNYGGILMVWDRLFGSFREEDERCVYGTRDALHSWDPLWANAEVYWRLLQDSWHTRHWGDKLRVWFKTPGWRPADVAARFPKPAFTMAQVQHFAPQVSRGVKLLGAAHFVLLLGGVAAFLWVTDSLPLMTNLVWLCALSTGLWTTGALLQGRLKPFELLIINSAALATATGALGLTPLHMVFKPLTMVLALLWVLNAPASIEAPAPHKISLHQLLLLIALLASLAGDTLLMLPGNFFIPGLVAFLSAHLSYIVLLQRSTPNREWFPSRQALLGTLGFGALMYALLWPGLPGPVLRVAVACYVVIIALMAAQAIGRAVRCRDHASVAVACGACLFMLSDSLLALNKFVQPLPLAGLWILSSYYAAQVLIARHILRRA